MHERGTSDVVVPCEDPEDVLSPIRRNVVGLKIVLVVCWVNAIEPIPRLVSIRRARLKGYVLAVSQAAEVSDLRGPHVDRANLVLSECQCVDRR